MIHHTANGNDWYIVPIYRNCIDAHIVNGFGTLSSCLHYRVIGKDGWYVVKLNCECSIHAITSEITEEQAAEMVTNEGKQVASYVDYTDPLKGHKTAIESLQSLLTEHGIEHAVILKKI